MEFQKNDEKEKPKKTWFKHVFIVPLGAKMSRVASLKIAN